MSNKVMKFSCRHIGLLKCRVCGHEHFATIMPGGKFRRGSWQCQYGCQLEELDDKLIEANVCCDNNGAPEVKRF